MLDEYGNTIPGTEDTGAAVVAEPVAEVAQEAAPVVEAPVVEVEAQPEPEPAVPEAPASDIVDKLEKILSAVGYTLPPLWAEAVALAKKAL